MRRLRIKIIAWMGLGFFCLALTCLLAFTAYSLHLRLRVQKRQLKALARSIIAELDQSGYRGSGAVPERAVTAIDERLPYGEALGNIAYAIVSTDGIVRHRSRDFRAEIRNENLAVTEHRMWLTGVSSGEAPEDWLHNWHFLYVYPASGYFVMLESSQQYELLERFAERFGVTVAVVVLLALGSASLYGRVILRPIERVEAALQEIRDGNLEARIDPSGLNDELRELVGDLNLTFAELGQLFRRVSQFSADAAHELKTPLTALRGSIDVCLSRDRVPEEYRETLAECLEEVALLSRIVDDLLLLCRPGGTSAKARFTPVDLARLAQSAVERFASDAAERGVVLTVAAPVPVPVVGDPGLLERLCRNLIHNAVKFSHDDGEVSVSVSRDGDLAVLTVRDRGIGIPEEHLGRIFDRFYQVEPSRLPGTGLGLALVKWVADLHEAEIRAESTVGEGTAFRVTFPVSPEPEDPAATADT